MPGRVSYHSLPPTGPARLRVTLLTCQAAACPGVQLEEEVSLRITQLQMGGTGFSPIASTFRKLPKVFANHLPCFWLGEGSWQTHTVPCSSHVTADVESGRHVTGGFSEHRHEEETKGNSCSHSVLDSVTFCHIND